MADVRLCFQGRRYGGRLGRARRRIPLRPAARLDVPAHRRCRRREAGVYAPSALAPARRAARQVSQRMTRRLFAAGINRQARSTRTAVTQPSLKIRGRLCRSGPPVRFRGPRGDGFASRAVRPAEGCESDSRAGDDERTKERRTQSAAKDGDECLTTICRYAVSAREVCIALVGRREGVKLKPRRRLPPSCNRPLPRIVSWR